MTATLLTSGRSVSIPLTVRGTVPASTPDADDWTIILPDLFEYWRRVNSAKAHDNTEGIAKPETKP